MRAFAIPTAQLAPLAIRSAAGIAGAIGVSALVGWAFDIPILKSFAPGMNAIQPLTALAIVLGAAGLWMAGSGSPAVKTASTIPAMILAALSLFWLLESATGGHFGVDLMLFQKSVLADQTNARPNPGRTGPIMAIGLAATAGALLLAPRVRARAGRAAFSVLASVGLAVALLNLLCYILRLAPLDNLFQRNPIALPAAVALAAQCLGVLGLRPDVGWVRIVAEQRGTGWAAMALLAAAGLLFVSGSYGAVTTGIAARDDAEAALRLSIVVSTLKDAETGQRGYLLTGSDDYLEPYDVARARLPGELDAAEAALSKVEGSAPELRRLRELTTGKLTELAQSVALNRAGDWTGALALVKSGRGKALMDAIRSSVDAFVYSMTAAAPANGASAADAAVVAALGTGGLAALAFWFLIATERVRREAAEKIGEGEAKQKDLLATLSLGTFMARDLSGAIRYWAEGCARLYGFTSEEAVGESAKDLLGTTFPVPEAEIEAALQHEGEWRGDLRQDSRDGRELVVTAHKVMRRSSPTQRAMVVEFLTDVTALRHAEAALVQSQKLLQAVMETTPGLIYAKDRQGRMTLLNGAAAALFERPRTELQGRTDLELLDDPAQAEIVMANDREVMEKGDSREFEEMAGEVDGRSRIWLSTKTPLRDPAGEVVGLVGVSIDITARKQAEDRLRQMVDELSHRVKNTLVTVQSIAAHTLRGADPVVYQMLEGRLQALAAVHDVLTGESWKDAGLIEVIDNALAPFVVGGAAQLTIDGPPIRLQPRVAVTLAIALHELATNAIKYGAWSDAAGQVRLTWEIVQGSAPRLRMIWAEERGPRVEAPTVRGFGSRMIERSLAHDLGGTAQIAFHANGLVCTMEAPLEEIAATTRALPLPRVGAMPEAGAWR